ncbi:MAG: hypothetical protein V2A73_18015, partial [Pseudomonadota bacterium]
MISAQELVGGSARSMPAGGYDFIVPAEETVSSLREAMAAKLLPIGEYQAAVIVGARGGAVLRALHQVAPGIRQFLVLESNIEMLRALQENLTTWPDLDGVFVSDL